MADMSVADELRFEALPDDIKSLALEYVLSQIERLSKQEVYDAGWEAGYQRGKLVGFRLGRDSAQSYQG